MYEDVESGSGTDTQTNRSEWRGGEWGRAGWEEDSEVLIGGV